MPRKIPSKTQIKPESKPPSLPKEETKLLRIDIPQPSEGPRVLLGAHTSISGGVSLAIGRAAALGFTAAQIFVKNNKQWFATDLSQEEITAFHKERDRTGLYLFGHNSYLVNLGSPKEEILDISIKSLIAELLRADALGLPFLVLHPGSHGGSGEAAGLEKISDSLKKVLAATPKIQTKLALENTAGQGSNLGYKFIHLDEIIKRLNRPDRIGVCLDTAHLLASGYDLRDKNSYESTFKEFTEVVGIEHLLGIHLNDSKTPFGSRVDRHEHLGQGAIGLEPFHWLMADPRWKHLPKVLETPKSEDMHEDVLNLQKLVGKAVAS